MCEVTTVHTAPRVLRMRLARRVRRVVRNLRRHEVRGTGGGGGESGIAPSPATCMRVEGARVVVGGARKGGGVGVRWGAVTVVIHTVVHMVVMRGNAGSRASQHLNNHRY